MVSITRDVAQLGSASALGAGCRRFKSCHPELQVIFNKLLLMWVYNF